MTKDILCAGNDCTLILDPATSVWTSTDNTSDNLVMWNDWSNQSYFMTFAIPIDLTRGAGANQIPVGATITQVQLKMNNWDHSFNDVNDYWDIWQYPGDTVNHPASGGHGNAAGYKDTSTSVGFDGAVLVAQSSFDDVWDFWNSPLTIDLSHINLTGPNTVFGSLDILINGTGPGDYMTVYSSRYSGGLYCPRYIVTYTIPSTTGASQTQLLMGK